MNSLLKCITIIVKIEVRGSNQWYFDVLYIDWQFKFVFWSFEV